MNRKRLSILLVFVLIINIFSTSVFGNELTSESNISNTGYRVHNIGDSVSFFLNNNKTDIKYYTLYIFQERDIVFDIHTDGVLTVFQLATLPYSENRPNDSVIWGTLTDNSGIYSEEKALHLDAGTYYLDVSSLSYKNYGYVSFQSHPVNYASLGLSKEINATEIIAETSYYRIKPNKKCKVSFKLLAKNAQVFASLYDNIEGLDKNKYSDDKNRVWIDLFDNPTSETQLSDEYESILLENQSYFLCLYGSCDSEDYSQPYSYGFSTRIITEYDNPKEEEEKPINPDPDPEKKEQDQNNESVSDNKPMHRKTVSRKRFEITYYSQIPFYGKKLTLDNFDKMSVSHNGHEGIVTKAKIDKKHHAIMIKKVSGFSKLENKMIKRLTKNRPISFSVNPYWVKDSDYCLYKTKIDGFPKSLKILINKKYYKPKPNEWSYNYNDNKIVFSGNNLAGEYILNGSSDRYKHLVLKDLSLMELQDFEKQKEQNLDLMKKSEVNN